MSKPTEKRKTSETTGSPKQAHKPARPTGSAPGKPGSAEPSNTQAVQLPAPLDIPPGTRPSANLPIPVVDVTPCGQLLKRPQEELVAALQDPATQERMETALATIEGSLQAAPAEVIVMALERLATHHPQPDRDEIGWKMWAEDWVEDLAGVPEDVLLAACADWRKKPKPFMPKAGELIQFMNPILIYRRQMLERGRKILSEVQADG